MSRLKRSLGMAVTACLAVVVASCGGGGVEALPETGATLEGTVTYGGEKVPLALVIVALGGSGGGGVNANCDDDGKYKLSNVPVGTVKIGVNTDAAKGILIGRAMAGVDPTKKGQSLKIPKHLDLPKKYQDPETSGITTRVERGPNKFDIEIKK